MKMIEKINIKQIFQDIENLAVNKDTESQLVIERDAFDEYARDKKFINGYIFLREKCRCCGKLLTDKEIEINIKNKEKRGWRCINCLKKARELENRIGKIR